MFWRGLFNTNDTLDILWTPNNLYRFEKSILCTFRICKNIVGPQKVGRKNYVSNIFFLPFETLSWFLESVYFKVFSNFDVSFVVFLVTYFVWDYCKLWICIGLMFTVSECEFLSLKQDHSGQVDNLSSLYL